MLRPGEGRPSGGYNADALGLSGGAFGLLSVLIEERVGVHFDEAHCSLLADKLSGLVVAQGLTSFLDYYYLLRYDPDAPRHWRALLDRLAVPETYFWRQAEQIEALASLLVPHFLARNPGAPLRIWSAACCTGEEPLSIAIALMERGAFDRGDIRILASDASGAMVERAQRGLYGERAFRALPVDLRERWFTRAGDQWRVDPRLAEHIEWTTANLAAPDDTRLLARSEIIFCRNVFIYFSDAAIQRVVRSFCERMPDDGWLFLGAPESLTRFSTDFELRELGRAFAYARPRAARELLGETPHVFTMPESPAA